MRKKGRIDPPQFSLRSRATCIIALAIQKILHKIRIIYIITYKYAKIIEKFL